MDLSLIVVTDWDPVMNAIIYVESRGDEKMVEICRSYGKLRQFCLSSELIFERKKKSKKRDLNFR